MTARSLRPALLTFDEAVDLPTALAYVRDRALRPAPVGRVGLELESHLVDLARPERRVPWDVIAGLLAQLPQLPCRSRVTVEPGGQIELSGPVADDPVAAIDAMRRDHAVLRRELARHGLGAAILGADPARPPQRVNPGGRYVAMEQHFTGTGRAGPGRAMMCSTAALQVNVEAGPAHEWPARVERARRLGPVLVALSACSPLLGGAPTGWRSSRQRVWSALDGGPAPGGSSDPAADWAQYVLDAPVMMLHAEPSGGYDPIRSAIPLRAWAEGSVRLGGRPLTMADVDHHLTTVFPPVRLRGYLEIRCLDAAPDLWWPVLAMVTCLLMDHPAAADQAAAATAPLAGVAPRAGIASPAGVWRRAACDGVADPVVRRAALQCLAAAAAVAPDPFAADIAAYAEVVAAGRTPGDDVLDRARVAGPLAVLEEAAHA